MHFCTCPQVWQLRVDVTILNHDGNMLDCASIAAIAALAHFRYDMNVTKLLVIFLNQKCSQV